MLRGGCTRKAIWLRLLCVIGSSRALMRYWSEFAPLLVRYSVRKIKFSDWYFVEFQSELRHGVKVNL